MNHSISLLYHDVVEPGAYDSSGFKMAGANLYKLDEPLFRAHLEAIAAIVNPDRRLFTFDDGGQSAERIGRILEERGWRGYFFITTDYIGRPGFLTANQIRLLHQRGHVIGSHSCSHPLQMGLLRHDQLCGEWQESRRVLSEVLSLPVLAASIPGGYYSRAVAETAADAGFEELFTSEPTSRPQRVKGILVRGRYSIQQSSRPQTVAALASGAWGPCLRQYVFWNGKKLLKRTGGRYWLKLREMYFGGAGQ